MFEYAPAGTNVALHLQQLFCNLGEPISNDFYMSRNMSTMRSKIRAISTRDDLETKSQVEWDRTDVTDAGVVEEQKKI